MQARAFEVVGEQTAQSDVNEIFADAYSRLALTRSPDSSMAKPDGSAVQSKHYNTIAVIGRSRRALTAGQKRSELISLGAPNE
jgi:hypothetical protein